MATRFNCGKNTICCSLGYAMEMSHEIKICLLLGRKVMANLDSTLKSRDITLPTKICLVKAMVFPVVMYGCESWTVKKAEHRRTRGLSRVEAGNPGFPRLVQVTSGGFSWWL